MIIYQSEVWGLIIVLVHEGQIEVSHFYEDRYVKFEHNFRKIMYTLPMLNFVKLNKTLIH